MTETQKMSQFIGQNFTRPSTFVFEIIQSTHVLRRGFPRANFGGDNVQRIHSNIRVVENDLTTDLRGFAPRFIWSLSCSDSYLLFSEAGSQRHL